MKKTTVKLLAALLAVTLIFITIPFAGADTGYNVDSMLIGDVDGDNSLTIVDATVIQRRLAGLRTLTELEEFLGDTDGDSELTIVDATAIQRRLAELGNYFWRNQIYVTTAGINYYEHRTYYPSRTFNSKIFVNTETRIVYSSVNLVYHGDVYPTRYDIFIDSEKVADHIEQRYFDYVFEKAGVYTVRIVPYNLFGKGTAATQQITVVDSPDRPYIADAEFDEEARTLSVRATGGAGDYRYRYYIRYVTPVNPTEPPTEVCTEPPYNPETTPPTEPPFGYEIQPDGTYQMVSDYTDASTIRIPDDALNTELEYLFYVCAVDKNGVESPLSYVFKNQY